MHFRLVSALLHPLGSLTCPFLGFRRNTRTPLRLFEASHNKFITNGAIEQSFEIYSGAVPSRRTSFRQHKYDVNNACINITDARKRYSTVVLGISEAAS